MTPPHIGQIIQNAVTFNPCRWREAAMASDSWLESAQRLFNTLHVRHINYVLVNGIAMLQYVEGRNTEDVDLIMAVASLKKLPELNVSNLDQDFARGQFEALQIDLLLTRNRLFEKVQKNYSAKQKFFERTIQCATVEGLLLLKLYALPSLYRQGNFARVGLYENDIATLLQAYNPNLQPLLRELETHLEPTDLASLDEVLRDIRQRIERFGKAG
ncbi:MAG: hypothetical protein JNL09_06055 [Anaerolineales bacterium]|nr:hypothetical protein [Anaerolineales bacterium]